jgi:hypothetical protein
MEFSRHEFESLTFLKRQQSATADLYQSDQISRIFALSAMVYFGLFFETYICGPNSCANFHGNSLIYTFD